MTALGLLDMIKDMIKVNKVINVESIKMYKEQFLPHNEKTISTKTEYKKTVNSFVENSMCL